MCDFDAHMLRPGAFARTPFGTPFFALVTDPNTDAPELGKLEVGGQMRQELAAWDKIQRARRLKRIMDDRRAARAAEHTQSQARTTVRRRVRGHGSPSFFEFVDRDDDRPAATGQWPAMHTAGEPEEAEGNCEVDGFVLIHRHHATGSVFWNHRSHSSRTRSHGRRRRHHRKYDDELEWLDEDEGGLGLWQAFMDLLRPVSEMDW